MGAFGYCNDPENGSLGFGLVWSGETSDQAFLLPVDWELPTMGRPYAITPPGDLATGHQARPPLDLCSPVLGVPGCPHWESSVESFAWSIDPPDATGDRLPFPHLIDGEDTYYYFHFARSIAVGDEERVVAAGFGQQPHLLTGCARCAFIWSLGSDDLPYLNLGEFLADTSNASGAESISIASDGLIRVSGLRRPFVEPLDPQELLDPLAIDPIAVVWEHAGGEDLFLDWCAVDVLDAVRSCTHEGNLELAASVNARGIVFAVTGTTLYKLAHIADFNGDDRVDGSDLGTLLGLWQVTGPEVCPWDLDPGLVNGERIINGADLGTLLGYWTGNALLSVGPLCCESESMAMIGGSGGSGQELFEAFLVALGFETDAEFVSWAEGKSPSQLEAAVEYALMVMNQENQ